MKTCSRAYFETLLSFQYSDARGFVIFDNRASTDGHSEFRTDSKNEGARIILWPMGSVRLRVLSQFSVLGQGAVPRPVRRRLRVVPQTVGAPLLQW